MRKKKGVEMYEEKEKGELSLGGRKEESYILYKSKLYLHKSRWKKFLSQPKPKRKKNKKKKKKEKGKEKEKEKRKKPTIHP